MRPPGLPVIAGIIRIPVVETGARGKIVLEAAKMRCALSSFYIANAAESWNERQRGMRERKIERTPGKMSRASNLRVMTLAEKY